jgi:multisubunit Na+/H+ antiporter MnhF subunit
MALPQPTVYGVPMSRLVCLSIAVVLSLLSVVATAAPIHKPRIASVLN